MVQGELTGGVVMLSYGLPQQESLMSDADRPFCVNPGCGRPSAHDGKRWRVHCGSCQRASWGGGPLRAGVTSFKTGICGNRNGELGLGFRCLIKWTRVPAWARGMTEIDHVDGNHLNNAMGNLQELCPMCHKLKGQIHGDYSRKP